MLQLMAMYGHIWPLSHLKRARSHQNMTHHWYEHFGCVLCNISCTWLSEHRGSGAAQERSQCAKQSSTLCCEFVGTNPPPAYLIEVLPGLVVGPSSHHTRTECSTSASGYNTNYTININQQSTHCGHIILEMIDCAQDITGLSISFENNQQAESLSP